MQMLHFGQEKAALYEHASHVTSPSLLLSGRIKGNASASAEQGARHENEMGWGRVVQALRMAAVVSDAKTGWDRHLKTLENPRMNESGMSRVSRTKQHKQGTAHAPAAHVPRWRPPMHTRRRGKTRRLLGARSVISTGMCVEMQANTASVNCRVGSQVLKLLSWDASWCPGGIKGIEGRHEINCGPGSYWFKTRKRHARQTPRIWRPNTHAAWKGVLYRA